MELEQRQLAAVLLVGADAVGESARARVGAHPHVGLARVVDGDAPPPPPLKGAERVGRAAHFQARASV